MVILGRIYWYALYPMHQLVFQGMLRGIARAASLEMSGLGGPPSASRQDLRTAGVD
jgi:hypothetical protein